MFKQQKPRNVRYCSAYRSVDGRAVKTHVTVLTRMNFKSPLFLVGLCLVLGLVVAFGYFTFGKNIPSKVESIQSAEPVEPATVLPPAVDEAQLSSDLSELIRANPGLDIGVSITDIPNNRNYTYGVDVPFVAASVGKILTASLYLQQVEKGKYSLDQNLGDTTARGQIQRMVAKSDNTAWKLLNDELTHEALESYARSIGITSYNAEENQIKPSDVALLLTKIYTHKLLNEENTSFLLSNMNTDQEEIQFIRKYIDPAITVYHKAGWLDDRAHDTAIVTDDDRPYVLVIFSKSRSGDYDFVLGQTLFERITTQTHTRLTELIFLPPGH